MLKIFLKSAALGSTAILVCGLPGYAASASDPVSTDAVNQVWLLVATALVLLMQIGFLLLESGSVRSKNSINVAQKNLADFILSVLIFGAFGFMLMFGASMQGVVGLDPELAFFGGLQPDTVAFFAFQAVFCGTAATIVSSAVAERMKLLGYIVTVAIMSAIIYPVPGHWIWGNLLNTENEGLLASLGFMDFAGSTVVHSVGGWVALAAIMTIGARRDKFDAQGNPRRLVGHNHILATMGLLILWVGWLGFNGGWARAGSAELAVIFGNTILAGAAGGFTSMILGRLRSGTYYPEHSVYGVLAGLVGITAGCNVFSAGGAFFVGASAAAIAFAAARFIDERLKLDDVIDVVAVHGVAGAWGTVMIAVLADPGLLAAGSRIDQLLVQIGGVALVFIWSFGSALLFLNLANTLLPVGPNGGSGLRVSRADEKRGMNEVEHATAFGADRIKDAVYGLMSKEQTVSAPLRLDRGDDFYDVAKAVNRLVVKINRERFAHEKDLKARIAEAEAANVAKSQFLATMSHEVRTPLNGIMGTLQLIRRSPAPDRTRSITDTALQSAQSLLLTLNDILDLSKLEANQTELEPLPTDVKRMITDAVSLMDASAAEAGNALTLTIDDFLPRWLLVDPTRLRQILLNLISNAIKFTNNGQISVKVRCRPEDETRVILRIEVKDTGIGIPQGVQCDLFRSYVQADISTTRRYGGTGLGLSICKRIVDLMGGEIGFTSAEKLGSTFWFTIPAEVTTAPSETADTSSAHHLIDKGSAPALTVLIVEDNHFNHKLAAAFLSSAGYEYAIAESGAEAVTAVRENAFDIILMDIQMPDMDGVDATKAIRALPSPNRDAFIIATTANAMSGDRERYLKAGMDDFISKPIDFEALLQKLANVPRRPGGTNSVRHSYPDAAEASGAG